MPQTLERTELTLEGMTCASCAARVEKTLNRLDGVDATVNFATERAAVAYDPARVELEDLVLAVEGAGYQASPLRSEDPDAVAPIRRRLIAAAVLTAPLVLIAMISPLQFGGWEWAGLALATPVVFWGGLGFHRAAALNLRHANATMDTLILLGRFLETRARRRSGQAIRALLDLGAKQARVLRGGEEVLVAVEDLHVGDRFVVRPGEKIATDGVVEQGESAVDQSVLTGESMPVEVVPGAELAGATINTYGRLVVRASKVGAETALAQIARLVGEAQSGKAP